MSDRDRILSMLKEGKLTEQEAATLLDALGELETTEESLSSLSSSEASGTATAAQDQDSSNDQRFKFSDLPFVYIDVLAGDLDVRVDPNIHEPVIDKGEADMHSEGQHFVIKAVKRQEPAASGDGLDAVLQNIGTWVSRAMRNKLDLDIRIPEGYGLMIDSKAGDVDVRDVPFFKASLLAGDVDAHNIGGVDLSLSAGDVDVSLQVSSGKHRIKATAGDVDVVLIQPSDVQVEAAVSVGDLDIKLPKGSYQRDKQLMGGSASFQLGEGNATLELYLTTGDLEVKIRD